MIGEGVPEAKHSFPRASLPYRVCTESVPGPFLGGESARGHPSLVKPAVKSAPATAAQPDWARSDELPRGLVPGRGWESWLWERRLGMWLRTVGRAGESHHANTGTAQGQRVATAPGAPPQGLAEAQDKALPPPHSRPGAVGTRQSHHTGYALKPAATFCNCCLWRRAGRRPGARPASQEPLEQKEVRPR